MIRSMTGFGSGRATEGEEEIVVEIRSVNSKYCDVKLRLPRALMALETELSRLVRNRLARGGIEIFVRRAVPGQSTLVPKIDAALAREYARVYSELARQAGSDAKVELSHLIESEGVVVVEDRAPDEGAARKALGAAAQQAIAALIAMREREGAALATDLKARLAQIRLCADRIATLAPQTVETYRNRLQQRIGELLGAQPVDPARIAQEVAMFADKSDVAEEVTRLRSHLEQFEKLIAATEPSGRRMDFLVQEMHREANTSGSKSQSAEISNVVVELKAEIERVREQVQNVE
jgi:uncharacterized protein (TIGR00255 family)